MAEWDPREDPDAAVVIDAGSCLTRAGFAGDDAPRSIFPTIVGKPKIQPGVVGSHLKDTYVGDEARVERNILTKVCQPVEFGIITNWDDIEKLWHHVFYNELRIDPAKRSVFLTETVFNPKANRERTIQTLFEKFEVQSAYLCPSPLLCQYMYGRTTETVVSIGKDVTFVVPMHEGKIIRNGIRYMKYAGNDLDYHLMKLMNKRGHSFATSADLKILQDIKEKLCYVVLDVDEEKRKASSSPVDKPYTLPDGKEITVGEERYICPEALFHPVDPECDHGIHELVPQSIRKCDEDIRKVLYSNIVLEGGSTFFPGLAERLQKEISEQAPEGTEVNVLSIPERRNCSWMGGSVLASLGMFQQYWITKDEYMEYGPAIVHEKCYQFS